MPRSWPLATERWVLGLRVKDLSRDSPATLIGCKRPTCSTICPRPSNPKPSGPGRDLDGRGAGGGQEGLWRFERIYGAKYPKVVACLCKDREVLLVFYDFLAEHWLSLCTTNAIKSAFPTIRHRSDRAKGCVSRETMLLIICKIGMCAEKRWRQIRGFHHLAKVIAGVKFRDDIEVVEEQTNQNRVAA